VRNELQVIAEQETQKENQGRIDFHAKKEAAAALHTDEARASVEEKRTDRLALRIAGFVQRGEAATWKELRSRMAGRDKPHLVAARDAAVSRGWITYEAGAMATGPVDPGAV
jgi:hypothetical protein